MDPREEMGEQVALGIFVDREANRTIRDWLGGLGIQEGPATGIELNRWLRDPIDERNYRVPDVRIGEKFSTLLSGTNKRARPRSKPFVISVGRARSWWSSLTL